MKLPVARLVRRCPWVRRAVAEAWREAREERFLSSLFRQVGEGGLQVDLAKLKPFERAALKQAMRVMGLKAKPGKDGRK